MPKLFTRAPAIFSPEPAKGWRPWGLLVPVLGLFFVIATVIVLQIALQHAHLLDKHENPVGLTGFAAFLLLPFGALGLVILAWVRFVERRPMATIGLGGAHRVRTFAHGHLTGIAMACVIVTVIWFMGGYGVGDWLRAFHSPEAVSGIAILFVCFTVQSSVEELVFRGWMLSAISAKFGVVIAVALSSALFAFLHYDPDATWIFAVNVCLFAVFSCCWALRSGNIWANMAWHAGWNWTFATGFELRVTGLDAHEPALFVALIPHSTASVTGGAEGPEASLACMLVLAVATVVTAWGLPARLRSRLQP